MSEMLKVQKGVPMPDVHRPPPPPPPRKYPVDTMVVGDFFFEPDRASRSVGAYISRITKNLPGKFSTRHCFMRQVQNRDGQPPKWELCEATDPGAREGTGVWRVE